MISFIINVVFVVLIMIVLWVTTNWILDSLDIDNIDCASVFITGCDSGFGKLAACALSLRGVHVYAGCYTVTGRDSFAKEGYGNVTGILVDVTDLDSLIRAKKLIEKHLDSSGKVLWGVVNNAGVLRGLVFHLASLDDYRTCMEVNYFGVIRVNEVFLPLVKLSRGRIVNVISILSRCSGMMEPYVASKSALGVYNEGLRRYLKDYGVHVASIEPGFHPSAMMNAEAFTADLDSGWTKLPEHLRQEYGPHFRPAVQRDMMELLANPPLASFNNATNVSNAICRALLSRWPHSSYLVGLDANLLYRFGPFVPNLVMDFVVRAKLSIYRTVSEFQDKQY